MFTFVFNMVHGTWAPKMSNIVVEMLSSLTQFVNMYSYIYDKYFLAKFTYVSRETIP